MQVSLNPVREKKDMPFVFLDTTRREHECSLLFHERMEPDYASMTIMNPWWLGCLLPGDSGVLQRPTATSGMNECLYWQDEYLY
jgi:hypothetical protein